MEGVRFVLERLARTAGVSRTWIEWESEKGRLTKTLVVEVDFETDPDQPSFNAKSMRLIADATIAALAEQPPKLIGRLKLVPKSAR